MQGETRRTALLALLAGMLLAAALLLPALDGVSVPARGDLPDFFWPMKTYTAARWAAELAPPLWNPLSGCGEPWLAQLQSGVLYPGDLPFLLPWPWGPSAAVALHVVVAACGATLLLWSLGCSRPASLLGGAVYAAGGPFVSLFPAYNNACSAAWLPWIVLGARAVSRGATPGAFALPIALAALAGEPALAAAGAAVGLVAAMASRGEGEPGAPPGAAWTARRLALGLLLGAGLAAAALLPFAELVSRSGRLGSVSLEEATARAVGPADLGDLLLPPSAAVHDGPVAGRGRYLLTLALGPAVLLLAAGGGAGLPGRGRLLAALAAPAVVGLLLSLGRSGLLVPLLHRAGLGLGLRYPARWFLFVHFLLALLAGAGLDGWLHGDFSSGTARRTARALLAATAAALGAGVVSSGLLSALDPARVALALGSALLGALLVFAVRRRAASPLLPTAAGAGPLLALLVAAPLPFLARDPLTPAPAASLGPGAAKRLGLPKGEAGASGAGPGRFFPALADAGLLARWSLGPRLTWTAEAARRSAAALSGYTNLYDRAPSAASPSPLGDPRRELLLGQALRGGDPLPLFALLDVRHVVSPFSPSIPGARLASRSGAVGRYDLATSSGRLFFARKVSVLGDAAASERLSRHGADPAEEAFVSGGPVPPPAPAGSFSAARVATWSASTIELETTSSAPSLLVLSQTFDPGWRLSVDGREAPLLRVDVALSGFVVPAGSSRARLSYSPASWRAGALLSVLSLLVLGAAWLGGPSLPGGRRA